MQFVGCGLFYFIFILAFFLCFFQVKEVDLDMAIKCLAQNYKVFKDSGSGLEPVMLSIGDRMAGMTKMNERKAGIAWYMYHHL